MDVVAFVTFAENSHLITSLIAQESSGGGSGAIIQLGILLWVGFFGGIGALIGSAKGRGGAGFLLGVLLGIIGWIIVAVMSRTPEKQAEYEAKVAVAVAVASGRVSATPAQTGQWAPDPFGRHDHRFFNGTAWTEKVSDAGQVGVDPPTFPLPADLASGEGWAPDPYGRYPQRFYKSSGWTAHVARDGTTFTDTADFPPPQQPGFVPPPPS